MPEVEAWLGGLGLGEYATVFREQGVDVKLLPELTNDDLKELGIQRLGDRKIILKAIAKLNAESGVASNEFVHNATAAERRQLTVMFCDLVGSVALSTRLDPEDLREVIRAYQKICSEAVRKYDGFIANYMGDGVLIYFGYPIAHEYGAERAVRAGLEVVRSIQKLNDGFKKRFNVDLAVRIGLATGPVVVGDIIGEGVAEQTAVVGETPNLAARLQAVAEPNQVIVASETRDLLGELFVYEKLGERTLKGISEPVAVWRVIRERTVASRFGAMQTRRRAPFVGRQDELNVLLSCWDNTRKGCGQIVLLDGEAGIGKSRLCEAFEDRLMSEGHQPIRMQCSPFRTNTALYPLVDLIRHSIDADGEYRSALDYASLAHLFSRFADGDGHFARLMAPMLSVPIEDSISQPQLSLAQRKRQMMDAALNVLQSRSAKRPMAVIFEDAHWIDPTSLEMLNAIASWLQDMRILIAITHRPGFKAAWPDSRAVTSIKVGRLNQTQIRELVYGLIDENALPQQQVNYVLNKTDGIPLFVEELTQMLLSDSRNPEGSRTGKSTRHAPEIPTTIHDLLLERLDQLGDVRGLAQRAACFGRSFSRKHLSILTEMPDEGLKPKLDELKSSGLIEELDETKGTFKFKHALVQQAAYSSLLRNQRIEIHAKIGLALEEELADEAPEILAHHFTEARVFDKASDYWRTAGSRAMGVSAFVEASAYLANALEQLKQTPVSPERDEGELLLLLELADPLIASRGYAAEEVSETFNRAREICQTLENVELLFPVLWGLVSYYIVKIELDEATALASQFVELANLSEMEELALTGNYLVGTTNLWRGDLAGALEPVRTFVEQSDMETGLAFQIAPSENPMIDALSALSWILWLMGDADQAEAYSEQCLELARSLDNHHDLAFALGFAAWFRLFRREYDKAGELATELIALASEHELTFWLAAARIVNGNCLSRQGQIKEAIDEIEDALEIWQAAGARLQKPSYLLVQAEAYVAGGQIEKAIAIVDEALEAVANGERHAEANVRRFKGELLEMNGQPDEAESWYLEAIEVARNQKAKTLELRATANLARLWQRRGKNQMAHQRLEDVFKQFDEGFDTPDLQEAAKLLDDLKTG